jgi:hypothetical protein
MTKEELILLDKKLDESNKIDNVLISKRGFYIYYNEPNKKVKEIKIHVHYCGFCAWGSGRDIPKEAGRNGVWIGPFDTPEQAEEFVGKIINVEKCSRHSCCA